MHDEAHDLMTTLVFTLDVITRAEGHDSERLRAAYGEAQTLVATIPYEDGSARPRIVACFHRFNELKAAEDITAAAWMLTAIQERIDEHTLIGWETLKIVSDKAASLLRPAPKTMH